MIEIPTRGKVGLPHYLKKKLYVGRREYDSYHDRSGFRHLRIPFVGQRRVKSNTYIRKLDAVIKRDYKCIEPVPARARIGLT